MKYKKFYIFKISLISALGGYLFGFDFAVISGALPFLQEQFGLNSYWEGFATGSLALGAIIGCIIAGYLAEKYGRRPGLLFSAIIFSVSCIAMAFSPSRDFFIFSRFVAGISVGMASMLSPMYIAEIAPAAFRGRMVAINQLTIVLGILFTNLINYYLRNSGEDAWRWMFGLGVIPSSLFLIGSLILPESPRWLLQSGKDEKARIILARIGDENFVNSTLQSVKKSFDFVDKTDFSALFKKGIFAAVLVGIGLAVFQQFCGINTVFNYTPKILESIGASKDSQLLQTVFIGGVNLVFTIFSMVLVDKIGRKPLMVIGSIGLGILYLLIGQLLSVGSSLASYFLLSAIGIYALTLAPVTWVLIVEIFPTSIRSKAISVAIIFLWLAYFVLVFTFPILFEALKDHTFYIYSIICFVGFLFVLFKVKETKGKSLEDTDNVFINH